MALKKSYGMSKDGIFHKDFGNAFKLLVDAVVLKRDVTYDPRRDALNASALWAAHSGGACSAHDCVENEMTIPRVGKFNLKGPYVAPSHVLG